MAPPLIDMTNPEAVLREVFDEDRHVKDQFALHLGADLPELAEALGACFRLRPRLSDAANRDRTVRTALVAAFVFGMLDDVLTSTKLLVTGEVLASGNLTRQVIEGIAMAALCSTDDLLIIDAKKPRPVMARYWKKLEAGDARTQGHRAVAQLKLNAAALEFNADAVGRLERAKPHYNGFSHAGTFSIAARVALREPGMAFVGGHFDDAKLDGYRAELRERISLCRVLPAFKGRMLASIETGRGGAAAPAGPH
ncbi:hypothetical protein [Burkholderia vietnamiensis]|uniref:hypothetical protein n=1 Tax=Burkholderia vietnamiensis TaxID=60552 RepID=UPI002655B429|nr:hypothetical protein [Burkholderia vietnamiensis]MDN8035773.1 hypothetical protein [Burkholderia vietnamiensis]